MQESIDRNSDTTASKKFERSIWKVCGIVALFIAVLWILKETFNVLLLVLAGIIIAIYFHGVSKWTRKKTNLPHRACMAISVAATTFVIAALIYFAGARIQEQVAELSETLPGTIQNVKETLGETYLGQKILDTATGSDAANKTSAFFETLFRSTFGILGDVYVVIFLGIFFTISPSLYVKGFLKLFPPKARAVSKHILDRIGFTLSKWIIVKIFSMFEVTVFTWIGLSIMGVPMAFALSVIAGLLNFVPNFGPLIALVPAVLVGLIKGFDTALLIAGLYILIQIIDGSVVVPALQQKLIRIPPAILIMSQLFMGILSGGWGVLLATPLLVIVMIIVDETYLKKQKAEKSDV
jgi:predicted PurR-regulated permease PerM